MAKYLTQNGGRFVEVAAEATGGSSGVANTIPQLDGNGRLPSTMMPSGVGADTEVIVASEALSAGDYVNVWNNAGTPKVRKADASTSGKEAMGYVLAGVTNGGNATVYFEGSNSQVTGQTAGPIFLSAATPGAGTSTPPSGSGNVVQRIGYAVSATKVNFDAGDAIVLA